MIEKTRKAVRTRKGGQKQNNPPKAPQPKAPETKEHSDAGEA